MRVIVGSVDRFSSLEGQGPFYLDAALIKPRTQGVVNALHPLKGRLNGHYGVVKRGWRLHKLSRTTGESYGVVVRTAWSGFVRFSDRGRYFHNVVVIHNPAEPIALAGDSGAVWISDSGVAAAMSFSGSEDGHFAFCMPVAALLDAFGMLVAFPTARPG
jgi:hypothetical protein